MLNALTQTISMPICEAIAIIVGIPCAVVAAIGTIAMPIHMICEYFRSERLRRQTLVRNFNQAQEEMEYFDEIHFGA